MHKNRRVSLKSFLNKNVLSSDLKDTIELEHLISKGHNFGTARKKPTPKVFLEDHFTFVFL